MCGGALKCFWMVMMRRDEWRRVGLGEPVWNQDGMNQHIMCTLCKCLLLWLMEVRPVHDCPLLFQGLSLGRGQIEANFICRLPNGSVATPLHSCLSVLYANVIIWRTVQMIFFFLNDFKSLFFSFFLRARLTLNVLFRTKHLMLDTILPICVAGKKFKTVRRAKNENLCRRSVEREVPAGEAGFTWLAWRSIVCGEARGVGGVGAVAGLVSRNPLNNEWALVEQQLWTPLPSVTSPLESLTHTRLSMNTAQRRRRWRMCVPSRKVALILIETSAASYFWAQLFFFIQFSQGRSLLCGRLVFPEEDELKGRWTEADAAV